MGQIFREPIIVARGRDAAVYPLNLRTITLASSLLLLVAAVPPPTVHARETDLAPIAKHYPVSLRTWTQNLQQTTLFVTPQVPPIGKSADPVPRAADYPVDLRTITYNAQEGVLFVAPAPPTNQPIDLPTLTPYPVSLRTWAVGTSLPITVLVSTPPAKVQPDFATAGPLYPVDLRTQTSGLLGTPLGGTPQAYLTRVPNVAPAPLTTYPSDLRTITQNLLLTTLAQPSVIPPGHFDCSVQWQTQYAVNLRTYVYYYVIDESTPPQPSDITTQLPRPRSYPLDLRTITLSRINLLSLPYPVGVLRSTELPRPRSYPLDLRTTTQNLLQTTLYPGVFTPVGATFTELPRARAYPSSLRTLTLDLQESTLAPPPVPPPNAQHDWPTPPARGYQTDLRTFVKPINLSLLGKDTFFGGPGQPPEVRDWSVPARDSGYPISLHFWSHHQDGIGSLVLFRRNLTRRTGSR